jgi:hypothetical protein
MSIDPRGRNVHRPRPGHLAPSQNSTGGAARRRESVYVLDRHTILQGGYTAITDDVLPNVATSANPFPNAPSGTLMVEVYVDAPVHIRYTGGAVDTTFHRLPAGNYIFPLSQREAQRVRMIGTASGRVTYWGVA